MNSDTDTTGNAEDYNSLEVTDTGSPTDDGSNGNDNQPAQIKVDPMIAINAAKKERAEALSKKQKELADAFGAFGDDYYSDLSDAYTDFQTPMLTSALDDATRGMYDGFKAKGILTQAEVDAGLGDLIEQKAIDSASIQSGASGYAQAKKDEVAKKQQSLGDALSAMAGGATMKMSSAYASMHQSSASSRLLGSLAYFIRQILLCNIRYSIACL